MSGLLVGMYYNNIDPTMSFQATLKGVVAQVVGGVGNVPGAIVGSLLLGLVESYGVALFGTSYRNLFAFVLLVVDAGAGGRTACSPASRQTPPEPLTGTFIAPSKPVKCPRRAAGGGRRRRGPAAAGLPNPYLLQILTNAWLYAPARPEPDAGGRHGRPGLARPRRAAGDRRLRLGAAGARSAACRSA